MHLAVRPNWFRRFDSKRLARSRKPQWLDWSLGKMENPMSLDVALASIGFRQVTAFALGPALDTGMAAVVYCNYGLAAAWMTQLTSMDSTIGHVRRWAGSWPMSGLSRRRRDR